MKVYTCTDHGGHWSVGTASVVIASTEEEARALLAKALLAAGLESDNFTLGEISPAEPKAFILRDGNY